MRPGRLPHWLGIAAGALTAGLVACGTTQPASTPAPPPPPAPVSPSRGPTPAPPALVKVTSSGAAPKQLVRATLKAGQTERSTWDVTVRLALSVGQMRPPALRPPTVRLSVRSQVSEVDDAGVALVETRIEKVELLAPPDADPKLTTTLATELLALTNVTIAAEVTPLGRLERLAFRRAEQTTPQVKTTLESIRQALALSPTLPPEAIGRGATWQVESQPRTTLLVTEQTCELRLPDAIGADGTARITGIIRQGASPQPIALDGLPPGAKLTLVTFTGAGKLRAQRSTRSIYGALDADVTTKLSATLEGPDSPARELRMETTYDVRLAPVD